MLPREFDAYDFLEVALHLEAGGYLPAEAPLHLDGLLATAKAWSRPDLRREGEIRSRDEVILPLAQIDCGGGRRFYRASAWWPPADARIEEISGRRMMRVDGPLLFWAWGYRPRIKRLLKSLREQEIAGRGTARLASIEIERLDEEATERVGRDRDWRRPDGRPARNVPLDWAFERGLSVGGYTIAPISPPYWRRGEAAIEVAR
jgi:hypothetical protein